MRRVRKLFSQWYIMVPFCLTFFAVSCSVPTGDPMTTIDQTPAENAADLQTGEDLFKGLYFMGGDVQKKIPVLSTMRQVEELQADPEAYAAVQQVADEVIRTIKSADKGFFTRFADGICSGDHLKVQKTLQDGARTLNATIQTMPDYAEAYQDGMALADKLDLKAALDDDGALSPEKLERMVQDELYGEGKEGPEGLASVRQEACSLIAVCVVWIWVAAAQDVAVALNVAAAVNVAAWAFAWVETVGPEAVASDRVKLQQEMMVDQIVVGLAK